MSNPTTLKNYKPPVPQFDENEMYGETGGIEGVHYIQGKNYFNRRKEFVREIGDGQALRGYTDAERDNRRKQMAKNTKFFSKPVAPAQVPEKIIKAGEGNARARAAEVYAG